MKKPDPQHKVSSGTSAERLNSGGAGEEFLLTGYDYMTNNATRDMIEVVPDLDGDGSPDPVFAAMERLLPTGPRWIYFGYKAFGLIDKFVAFSDTVTTQGWPDIQYANGGFLDGNVMIMGHSGGTGHWSEMDLTNFAPTTPFNTVTWGSNFPSFAYSPSAVIATDTDLLIYASLDDGASFTELFLIGDGDPNVNIAAWVDAPSEMPVQKSGDDMTWWTYGIFDGVNADTTGIPQLGYLYGSTDGGATWGGLINAWGAGANPVYGQVSNRPNYAPYFENFSQISLNVDDNGYAHITANGYGEAFSGTPADTVNWFTMLYWNHFLDTWVAVTDTSMEPTLDDAGNSILDHYPGNGIGNAYGTTSVSDDGQIVFVAWQGPEYTDQIGGTFNIYPGDGGAVAYQAYYVDIYYRVSEDMGQTWGPVGILEGGASVMETYPVCAPRLEIDGNMATVHYLYYDDPRPGVSLFDENDFDPTGAWKYNSYSFALTTGVNDDIVVNNFELQQNYPNPFNPNTNIKYSLAERSVVSLKVYDVLGNEVATLVNASQEAGAYDVNFNAANLASGLYIYTLKTGDFSATKKMMLLK